MKVETFPLLLFGVNCYVVFDPDAKEAVIIDPGIVDNREIDRIDNFLTQHDLKVVAVINTHLHIDHALANSGLSAKYNVPVLAHKDDAFLGDRMKDQAREFRLPFKIENAGVTGWLSDGERIDIGNGHLDVIHVPGHSPGGIALYDPDDGFLISGDSLFEGSIGRTDLPGGNFAKLADAIGKKLYTLPDDTVVYPGHGPTTTIGREKKFNPFVKG